MRKRNIIAIILVLQMFIVMVTGCASKANSGANNAATDNGAAVTASGSPSSGGNNAKPSDSNTKPGNGSSTAPTVTVDKKFVSRNYMLTTLVNSDTTIKEDQSVLSFTTQNAAVNICLEPGVQNLAESAKYFQSAIPTHYTDGQAGDISDGYLFGYRAKLMLFSCTYNGTPCEGLMALCVANQSLYSMSFIINGLTSDDEFELMKQIISNILLLAPTSVDSGAHTAQYTDPYSNYEYYDDGADYYDIEEWYFLPYECYAWFEVDYSAYDETLFAPDWDYYADDSTYWDWGWDASDEWYFYDTYEDYYDIETYETEEDYYTDYDYDSYDVWASEDFDYYDDGSYDDGSYDDGSYDDGSYDDGSYDDGSYDDGSYDDGYYDDAA